MGKIVLLMALVASVYLVEAFDPQRFVSNVMGPGFNKLLDPSNIANIRPSPNGNVIGAAISSQRQTFIKDGVPVSESQGTYIINKNGEIIGGRF